MGTTPVIVRQEQSGDAPQIREINLRAFGASTEADIVDALREGCPHYLSLVAQIGDRLAGQSGIVMKISGTYQFDAPAQKVWDTLMDTRTLAGCIPGCDGFNPTGDNEYQAMVTVGVGPVRGRYDAKIALRDQEPPGSYRLVMEGSGPAGFANGEARVTLSDHGGKTSVQVEADAQVGGAVARVGQRLIGTVAKGLMDRFFGCLQEAV